MAKYSPSLVANAFLWKAKVAGVPLTHMKLQKLVFFVHAWSLALKNESVVSDRPEAWTYGPVYEDLYHELKGRGSLPVSDYLLQMNSQTGQRQAMMPTQQDAEFWLIFQQVWDRYAGFSAMQLSALTHEAGGPWEKAKQSHSGWLSDELIRDHYRAQLPHAT